MKNEVKHTAHSSYRCEYHVVFAPKYRRKVIYKAVRRDIIEIIKKLCKEMKVEIIEGEACPDHIHLLVSTVPFDGQADVTLYGADLKQVTVNGVPASQADIDARQVGENVIATLCAGTYVIMNENAR